MKEGHLISFLKEVKVKTNLRPEKEVIARPRRKDSNPD